MSASAAFPRNAATNFQSIENPSVTVGGSAAQWDAWGFAVDTTRNGLWVGATWIQLQADERGVCGWSVAGTEALLGLPPAATRPPEVAGSSGREGGANQQHPNGVTGIDHVVVSHPNLEAAESDLLGAGIEIRRWRDVPAASLRQGFAWLGDVVLELIGPTEARPGNAAFFGLALTSSDLHATAAAFGPASSEVRDAVQPGRSIITIDTGPADRPKWLAVMSPHPPRA